MFLGKSGKASIVCEKDLGRNDHTFDWFAEPSGDDVGGWEIFGNFES